MSIRKRLPLALAIAVGTPLLAQAQPVSGLYIAGGAGINGKVSGGSPASKLSCSSVSVGSGCDVLSTTLSSAGVKPSYDIGFALLGSVGWGYGNGLRAEIEGSYRNNGISSVAINRLGSARADGTAHTYAVMTNVLYDVNIGQGWIHPYIGAGAGYAWTNLDNIRPAGSSDGGFNGAAGNFAYQAMVGAGIPIAAVPGLSLTVEYRFMGVIGDPTYHFRTQPSALTGQTQSVSLQTGAQYNHAGLFGLRYVFGSPRPSLR